MKKNDFVVRIIDIMGGKTATVQKVESVKKGAIALMDISCKYDAKTLREIDPVIPGCYSYLVEFDGGEVDRLGLK